MKPHQQTKGEILLKADQVEKRFPVRKASLISALLKKQPEFVHAVNGISLEVHAGQTIAIVGESGSGKTTLAKMMLNLLEPTGGKVIWRGRDVAALGREGLFEFRKDVQIIFQNPGGALNSRKKIYKILSEPLNLHFKLKRGEVDARIREGLVNVGLNPSLYLERFPHELSGGQRQRVCIARALSLGAKIIFADEPVSSLDVSIQAQILILLKKLKEQHGLTYVFITHDLALTRSFATHVYVMYLGEVVESGPVEQIFSNPLHPYTKLLLASTPIPNPHKSRGREAAYAKDEMPSSLNPPPGCLFHTRCSKALPECRLVKPAVKYQGDQAVSCHLV